MTKKSKLILGSTSLIAVIAIVPVTVISCGSDSSNTTIIDNNVSTLKNLNIKADVNADITATNAAKLLPNGSSNLDILNKYFNTNLIVNAATNNGASATYSASLATTTSTTTILANATNDVSNTLIITVTMTLGSVTSTQNVNVTEFPTQDQAILNSLSTTLSNLKLNALSTQNATSPANIYAALKDKTSLSLVDLETYFDTSSISTTITAASSTIATTYAIASPSQQNITDGSISIIVALTLGTATKIVDLTINGFLFSNQSIVNSYIKSITDLSGDNAIKAKSGASLPASITNSDYVTFLDNVPTPTTNSGITLSFVLSNPNSTTGTVEITITASIAGTNAATASTTAITVNGFAISNLAVVNAYVAKINTLSGDNIIKAKSGASLPSTITNANYSTILDNVPAPFDGATLSFALSNSNATTGTVDVVITASIAAPNAVSAVTNSITVNGFLSTNQIAVNNYIDSFTNADITGKNTYLSASIPSVFTPANINTYFNNIPVIPANITVAFSSSLITNTGLTLSITVSAATNATEKSTSKVISGFGTDTSVLNTLVSSLTNGTYEVLSDQQSKTPTQIYNALALTSNLQLSDFNTYFTTTGIQDSINTISSSITISSIELIKVSTSNLTAGTLEFTINLLLNGATASATITLSSLTKQTVSEIQKANLASLTTISNNLKSSTFATTKVGETADVANTAINAIGTLNSIDQLSDYFASSSITDIINSVSGVTYTELKVENPTTLDNLNGIITFSLTLSLGTLADAASINTQFTIKDFSTPLNTPLNASLSLNSVYANYWTTTPSSSDISTLGHSANTISLYIGGDSPFNSSATLTSSGTSLPPFLNNINWPTGLSNSDVTSWAETGNNTTGTATYTLIVNSITKPITLTVSGFMKVDRTTIFVGMSVTLTGESTIPTPSNGSVNSLSSIGVGINWNNLTMSDFGPSDSGAAYAIVNSDPTLGTANFVITLPNGNAISFPISGYLTTSQQAVNTYINSVNATIDTANAISGNGKDIPSTDQITNDTFSTYFNNIPKAPTGITLTFVLSNPNPETGTVDIVITATDGTSTKASNKITVSGFLASNQALIDTYIKSITDLSGVNVIKAINDTTELPIALTNENYSTYLTNVPAPTSGITLSFELNTPDPTTGTVNITITATIGSISQKTSISVTGFLTTNQKAISAYITTFEASASIIKGIDTISPSDITFTSNISMTDIAKYFSGILTPISGITATFNITTTSGDSGSDATGIVGLTVTLTADHAIGATSTSINISGFLTTNQAAINAYITAFEASTSTIKGINTILPSNITPTTNITMANITNYFSGIVVPTSGITAIFNITTTSGDNGSDVTGTVGLTITLTADHAIGATSTSINISGFLTQNQTAINAYIQKFKDATITGINTFLPSKVPPTLDASQIDTYFTGVPAPTGLNATFSVDSTDTTSTANGTLSLSVTLVALHATPTTATIQVSGFKSVNQILKSQIDAIKLGVNANLPAPVVTTPLTFQNAQPILATLDLTKAQISTLNSISGLTTSVTASSITDGTATLEYSATIDGIVATYSQSYTGFSKGSASDIQTNLESYLSTTTNAITFLQNYLNVNQSFLSNLIVANAYANTYWSYVISAANTNSFKGITVSYDTKTKAFVVNATIVNPISLTTVRNDGSETSGNTIPADTQMVITLPFVFSKTPESGYSPINITVSNTGSVTLSWNNSTFSSYQGTTGITTQYIPKGQTATTSLFLPWRIANIPSIIF